MGELTMDMRDYEFGNTTVRYLINEEKKVSMLLIPQGMVDKAQEPWARKAEKFDPRLRYMPLFDMGCMAHFHLQGDSLTRSGITMKNSLSEADMRFLKQEKEICGKKTTIKTVIGNKKGIKLIHSLNYNGGNSFEIVTEFENGSGEDVILEMLTSFSLDNLSIFADDDGPGRYNLHRFYGGWSLEGKHICVPIEELGLEKSWAGYNGQNERFGCFGSYPVDRYFPAAAFEDKKAGVVWIAQLAHNSAWQMELTRCFDTFSFSGGIGDNDFCGWSRTVPAGGSFCAPRAYVAAVEGDIEDACDAVLYQQKVKNRTEEDLPIAFNEYCATWGKPTQDKMISFCDTLKEFGVKYLVIDAGWCNEGNEQTGNGEWLIDKAIFPDMKKLNSYIRENGMIPGIWMEFEVTTEGSVMFESKYDYMHLKHNDKVIKSGGIRSYWDFRRPDVIEYLSERVIDFLREYGFGYIKVDYNANTGKEVDGKESGSENLRVHLEAVREFFVKIKTEIPEIIIENCAAGGHRSEPSMMEITSVTSFSDVHEGVEIPYVAANMHRLMLPEKEFIWAVLHGDDSDKRMVYSLSATFLGRMCLSGNIDELDAHQKRLLKEAIDFYKRLSDVIRNGKTRIEGTRGRNTRYPTGTQVVVRGTDKQILMVVHNFENPAQKTVVVLPPGFKPVCSYYAGNISFDEDYAVIEEMEEFSAAAVLLEKEE